MSINGRERGLWHHPLYVILLFFGTICNPTPIQVAGSSLPTTKVNVSIDLKEHVDSDVKAHWEWKNREIVAQNCSESGGSIKFSFQCFKAGRNYDPDPETRCTCVEFLSACCIRSTSSITGSGSGHPLDPLTPDEISSTRTIIQGHMRLNGEVDGMGGTLRYLFIWITLKEPPKVVLLPYFLSYNRDPPAGVTPRKSFTLLLERRKGGKLHEIVVNLETRKVESLVQVKDVQPLYTLYELHLSQTVMKADPRVRSRCAKLGFRDMNLVDGDPWSIGYIGDRPEWVGRRLVQLFMFGKTSENENHFAHPFDFLVVVDIQAEEVVAIENLPTHDSFDTSNNRGNSVPLGGGNYDYRLRGGQSFLRQDDRPIKVTSPEGASYKVNGNRIDWQNWRLRLGFNAREGLILYTCSYTDTTTSPPTTRPIFYRASLTEMFIPYGDPRPPFQRKAVYDVGQYGIGFWTGSQRHGIEVIGASTLFPAILNNVTGHPVVKPGAVSLTEEDAGILWQHYDIDTNRSIVVRSHRLVLSFIATVGNYDYIFMWRFYQDASIQMEVRLTGILSTNLLAKGVRGTPGGYGTVEAPQVNAQYHQHWFAVRMDVEIDGNGNSVHTSDAVSLPKETGSPKNPYGQGFTLHKTPLRTAAEGRSYTDPGSGRVWVFTNPGKIHKTTGFPTGYKLVAEAAPLLLMKESSPIRPAAAFLDYPVWVIPYVEGQIYPGGFYLSDGVQGGLPSWVAENPDASLDNEDIVLFHMIDVLHIPRVEDWPVMPAEMAGFWFKPQNFFMENPAVNVPPAGGTGNIEL